MLFIVNWWVARKVSTNRGGTGIIFEHGARRVDAMAFRCVDEYRVLVGGHWPHVHLAVAGSKRNGGGQLEYTF